MNHSYFQCFLMDAFTVGISFNNNIWKYSAMYRCITCSNSNHKHCKPQLAFVSLGIQAKFINRRVVYVKMSEINQYRYVFANDEKFDNFNLNPENSCIFINKIISILYIILFQMSVSPLSSLYIILTASTYIASITKHMEKISLKSLATCCKHLLLHQHNNPIHCNNIILNIIDRINESECKYNNKHQNIQLLRILIDCYSYCGQINKAKQIYDFIPNHKKNLLFITAMMKHYIKNGKYKNAMEIYETFQGKHDNVSNMLYIKACASINALDKGQTLIKLCYSEIHKNVKQCDIRLLSTLIDFYGKSGNVIDAELIFKAIPNNKIDNVCVGSMMNVLCSSL